MVVTADAPTQNRRPINVQVLRGIGWTAGGLLTLFVAGLLIQKPGTNEGFIEDDVDGHTTVAIHPQWKAIALVVGVLVASTIVFRRLRKWQARPRWLLPLVIAILFAASLVALKPFGLSEELTSRTASRSSMLGIRSSRTPAPRTSACGTVSLTYRFSVRRTPTLHRADSSSTNNEPRFALASQRSGRHPLSSAASATSSGHTRKESALHDRVSTSGSRRRCSSVVRRLSEARSGSIADADGRHSRRPNLPLGVGWIGQFALAATER